MIRSFASAPPEPKTTVFRPWESLQRVHPALLVSMRRSADPGPPSGSPTSGSSRVPSACWKRRWSARARAASARAAGSPGTSGGLGLADGVAKILNPIQDQIRHLGLGPARERDHSAPAVEQD